MSLEKHLHCLRWSFLRMALEAVFGVSLKALFSIGICMKFLLAYAAAEADFRWYISFMDLFLCILPLIQSADVSLIEMAVSQCSAWFSALLRFVEHYYICCYCCRYCKSKLRFGNVYRHGRSLTVSYISHVPYSAFAIACGAGSLASSQLLSFMRWICFWWLMVSEWVKC